LEQIFLKLQREKCSITFTPFDALKAIDHSVHNINKVSYSREWEESKASLFNSSEVEIKKEGIDFDWTYSSRYKGTLELEPPEQVSITKEGIPVGMLKVPDPILFFKEIHLYEDELSDNGTAEMTIKIRVMPRCFFVLLRFWLRIDQVTFRVFETRLFHDFEKNYLLRDFQAKESSFKSIVQMIPDPVKYSDPNIVCPLLSLKESIIERIQLY